MFIADFHIHSKYSRATSKEGVPEILELWARRKGLALIGTGDFTHPAWREELKEKLVPAGEGLYALKKEFRRQENLAGADDHPRFIVTGEISSIYKKNGKVRKVHNLILLPGIEQAEALSHRLEAIGNLHSDGRPILGLDSRDLLEITLAVCPEAIFIPAHIWTPHFSLFGAYSGFDSIEECFGDLTGYIYALETGLSSDPPMNWRLSALDRFTLVSNSDAHSPGNLAREANLFNTELSYPHIAQALKNRDTDEFYGTIEFFPEEGKYHYDGHRNCKVCFKPAQTQAAAGICPACGGRITVGVLHRVEALADRDEGFVSPAAKHFESLVPLAEVIAASTGLTTASLKVKTQYLDLIHNLGPELFILREAPLQDIELKAGAYVAEGIRRLRRGQVEIHPGYDGEYGRIQILDKEEIDLFSGQLCLFDVKQENPLTAKVETTPDKLVSAPVSAAVFLPEPDEDRTRTAEEDIPYGLNPEQWEAVAASEPAVVVIAGPGTGKTKTLVSRIAYLVEKRGVSPAQITAVTFTNQAAKEMRERLEKHFGNKRTVKAMTIGTFHSICLQLLTKPNNGRNAVTLIDEANALSIAGEIRKTLQLKNSPRDILREISLLKNGAQTSRGADEVPPGVYDRYCAELARFRAVDYDDILLEVVRQYESNALTGGNKSNLPNAFAHLLVDEFQDVSHIQYRLIKEWGKNSSSIFVIGDPDQSIYGFRGSDPHYFTIFQEDFPGTRQCRLARNYRSTPEILSCAQSLISKEGSGGRAENLLPQRENGARVRLLKAENPFQEALFVAKEINQMVGGIDMLDAHVSPAASRKRSLAGHLPRGLSDIAILYRVNRQAAMLEQCLRKEGIPYVVAGRDEFLFEPEVQRTLAFFRFLTNPGDLLSLRTCLRAWGACQEELAQKILAAYTAADQTLPSLEAILNQLGPDCTPDQLSELRRLFRKYEPAVCQEKPGALIETWMNDNQWQDIRCLDMLLHTALLHDEMLPFLQNLVLGQERDIRRSGGKVYAQDAVSLMTMHGAKGLEFPVVFVCGLNQGMIPFHNHRDGGDIDEERRLFYVGLTRAKDELVLLTSPAPSPFLAVLPKEDLATGDVLARRQMAQMQQVSLF